MKKIEVNNYLDLSNEIITSSTTMKPVEHLLCLVILSNIQAQIKRKDENLGKISINRSNLSIFFKKDTLKKSTFTKLVDSTQECCYFRLKDDSVIEDFFLFMDYDGDYLDVEYDVDKVKLMLVNKKNFTQLDIEYMCNNLTTSKNAIIMYGLICYSRTFGKLSIKKETLLHILLKDYKADYPNYILNRDIKRALDMFKDIIGKYKVEVSNRVYTITFDKFTFAKKRKKKEELNIL